MSESEMLDIIERPIREGDYVAFYSNVYKVLALGKPGRDGYGSVRIKLADPSKTTKSVVKFSRDMCVIPAEEVTIWLLKKGYS